MLRYLYIQKFYPILSLLAQFYFGLISIIFTIYYRVKPKQRINWTSEELKDESLFLSAKKAAEKIRNKEITSTQLVDAYIKRIERVQPVINAIVAENFKDARSEAEKVDIYLAALDDKSDEFKNLAFTKPLLGIPFTFKNNMDMKGFVTVAGFNKFLNNPPADKDSIVMARLRETGAIPIALTNLPKLAMNWCTENEVFGRTCNPYDLRRIPGGSSGGESAIIAAGASIFGIGNDLAGSVRIPAFMCGLFGLKPTKDIVSLEGFVPASDISSEVGHAQWAIGPLCRYAEDLLITFATLSGKRLSEVNVAYELAISRLSETKILYFEDLNIWFVENLNDQMRSALRKVVQHFKKRFNRTALKVDYPLAHHLYEIWGALGFGAPAKNLGQIVSELPKFLKRESDMTCCAWFYDFLHAFVATRNEEERKFMLHKLDQLRSEISIALGDNGLLLLPPWPTTAPFHGQNMFTSFNLAYTQLFNVLGFPALVCPVGFDSGDMPLGVQLVGPNNSEPLLMAAALEIERAFGGWKRP